MDAGFRAIGIAMRPALPALVRWLKGYPPRPTTTEISWPARHRSVSAKIPDVLMFALCGDLVSRYSISVYPFTGSGSLL